MIKLIAFDLDGTLCYTMEDIAISVNYALRINGFPERSLDYVRTTVGNSTQYMIRECLPPETPAEVCERVHADYTEHYGVHSSDHTSVYPGVAETLEKLKAAGYTLAVVSNKPHRDSSRLMEKLFPSGTFAFVLGMMKSITRKPAADPLLVAMEYLGFTAEETLYVGDSEVDVRFADAAGVPCVSCRWGYRPLDVLLSAGAKHLIGSMPELIPLVEELNAR